VAFFALTTVHGPNWDASRSIREQEGWSEHARFMDRLVDQGFVVLGGPIADGDEALLAVEAGDVREVQAKMAADPWASMGLLEVGEVRPWTIWLDGRHRRG
jgi:uncharacterized protein YciI